MLVMILEKLPRKWRGVLSRWLIEVRPGTFLMGSSENDAERGDNEAQHEVTITKPFYLSVYPVTQKQWQTVMGNNPSYFSRDGQGKDRGKKRTQPR